MILTHKSVNNGSTTNIENEKDKFGTNRISNWRKVLKVKAYTRFGEGDIVLTESLNFLDALESL